MDADSGVQGCGKCTIGGITGLTRLKNNEDATATIHLPFFDISVVALSTLKSQTELQGEDETNFLVP